MKRVRQWLFGLALISLSPLLYGEDKDTEAKTNNDFASPDGRFAFRLTGKSDEEIKTFDLIDKGSKKMLLRIASEEPDSGPSARFGMEVLWRPDSKAFAVTETLWKRGSLVEVYLREGPTFRKSKMPKLGIEITEKMKGGKQFPHVVELDSQTPTEWHKDGSLVVEIETILDGDGSTLTVNRTVALGFDRPGNAKILKSTIKHDTETDLDAEAQAAWDKGDLNAALALYDRAIKRDPDDLAAYYDRGRANFVMRNWTKALTDFQRHCELRKGEANQIFPARFYLWLIRARLGERAEADKELAPYMEGHPPEWSNGWDARTANFLLDRISEADFLTALSDNPAAAWFYAGMKRLLANDRVSAAEDFKKAVAKGAKTADEYHLATAELKALAN